jgi:hypothetical protein
MKLPRRNFLHLAAVAPALPAVSRIAWAQSYPSRPITMIVPPGRADGRDWTGPGRGNADDAWSTRHR